MTNPLDAGIAEFTKTIEMLGVRLANMAIENAGLKSALAAEKKKSNGSETPTPAA